MGGWGEGVGWKVGGRVGQGGGVGYKRNRGGRLGGKMDWGGEGRERGGGRMGGGALREQAHRGLMDALDAAPGGRRVAAAPPARLASPNPQPPTPNPQPLTPPLPAKGLCSPPSRPLSSTVSSPVAPLCRTWMTVKMQRATEAHRMPTCVREKREKRERERERERGGREGGLCVCVRERERGRERRQRE